MVSQYDYSVYAHHHKQKLMQEARVSRLLKRQPTLSRKDDKNSPSWLAWLLHRLTPDSIWDTNQTRSTVDQGNSLTAG